MDCFVLIWTLATVLESFGGSKKRQKRGLDLLPSLRILAGVGRTRGRGQDTGWYCVATMLNLPGSPSMTKWWLVKVAALPFWTQALPCWRALMETSSISSRPLGLCRASMAW